uniref:Integrase, catalytic region, zinc finger, CCHC-type, peptidase aspartic, catalytic n=1 Tax=Tanacetum cinerariifolium TaxID=118510 RepID=A0A6L2N2V3_TANCI|nr:integrase, catalytic region, zinc finger, CCHC-type, peptidase aspartic, catalytic [Tanacetum cinerariifolium]
MQQKNQPEIKKPKKVGFIKSLATPKPRKPRFLLRWSPTGKMFDSAGKLVAPSNSESHVDCSNGCSKHMTGNLKLFINFFWKFMGTVRFGNDHVAAIMGFGDLQTMDMTTDQQVALDEALAFLVTSDVPEIYMQEFWATVIVHHHSIYFKMNNKKRIVNLEYFREMLHICPRFPNQTFDELPFEEEILAFLRYLGHSGEIKKITAVNINKLHRPWRLFAAIINKCLRAAPPKTKASVRKTQRSSDTTMPPPMATSTRLSTSAKGKQRAKSSKAKDEGTGIIPWVPNVPTYESDEEISWKSSDKDDDNDVDDQSAAAAADDDNDDDQDSDNDGDDFVHLKLSTLDEEAKNEESFDPIVQTPSQVENSNDESHGMNVGGEKGPDAEDDDEELYRGVNINLEGRDIQMTDVHTTQVLEDTHVTLTLVNPDGQQQSSSVSSQFVTSILNPSHNTCIDYLFESTHQVDVPVMITVVPLLVTAPTLHPPSIPIISQISGLAKQPDCCTSFNELIDTHVDFSAFLMNRLKVDTLTPELLASPTYKLMKGSCKSLVELKFFLEEVYKVTTNQLDWNNPKGQQYLHNLVKPLPLIPNSQGHRVIPFDHFINNDLKYLRGGASIKKYTTSITKTKAVDYRHIQWIEDLVPRTMWSQTPVSYDKYALWGISH